MEKQDTAINSEEQTVEYWNCWNSHRYSKIATGSTRLYWRSIKLLLLASFGAVEVYFCLRFAEAEFEF
jgi:hypothetical protein